MKYPADQAREAANALVSADASERAAAQTSTGAASSREWIALGVGDTLPAPVMSYVIGVCRRMQADLLLICVDATRIRALLAEYQPDLHGIECRIETLASTAAVLRVLNLHAGLLFAVSGAENDPLRPLLRARRGMRSPVPVVLVSPKTSAGQRQIARKSQSMNKSLRACAPLVPFLLTGTHSNEPTPH